MNYRTSSLIALIVGLIVSASTWAAPPKGSARSVGNQGASRVALQRGAGSQIAPSLPPAQAFNRNAIGGASGVSPGMRSRGYAVADGLKRPGGAQAMGLRSGSYRNDGTRGSVVLPKSRNGKPVDYTRTDMRPGGHKRKLSNGRVITGSDGSIYVTRHYGQDGGKTKRIQ